MGIEGVLRKVQFVSPRKDEMNNDAINLFIFRGFEILKRNPVCNDVRGPRKDALLFISRATFSNPKNNAACAVHTDATTADQKYTNVVGTLGMHPVWLGEQGSFV
jgi:hypothetical protein